MFWHDFYPNFKANFLPDCDRTFYVFTDAAHIDYEDAPDVRRIYQKALPWPQSTMLRFDAFLGQADALQGYDYLFFANANLHCTRVIRADELLPDPAAGQSLTVVCHLPYYGKNPIFHPYDRSGKSRASIPYSCGQYYVAGGLNGGTAAAYLALCRELTYQRNVKLGRPCAIPSDRDAGIVQTVTAAVNAENPLEGERLLLDLEFRRLDGMIGLHNFDDHALFGYAMKLQLLERQRTFRYEAGKRAFDELMAGIRQQVSSL